MKRYWAVMPRSSGAPGWTLTNLRIEKSETAAGATRLAFGRETWSDGHKYSCRECGTWLCKDLGPRIAVVQSSAKKMALLNDRNGWVDPYAYRLTSAAARDDVKQWLRMAATGDPEGVRIIRSMMGTACGETDADVTAFAAELEKGE